MTLACMYTIVFTMQVQNRASALNIVQIQDESLITVGNNNDNKVLLIMVYVLVVLYYSPILQQNW